MDGQHDQSLHEARRGDDHGVDVLEMSRSLGGADGHHLALPCWACAQYHEIHNMQLAGSLVQVTSIPLHVVDV